MPAQVFNISSLVDQHFSDDSRPETSPPEFVIVMGGIAAGKTTIRKKFFSKGYVLIDAAVIFTLLDGWEEQPFPGELEDPMNLVGALIAERALGERRNIVTELIGGDYAPIATLIEAMKKAGYKVKINAVTCDIEEAIRRNEARLNVEISAYVAEPYQHKWLMDAANSVSANWCEAKKVNW